MRRNKMDEVADQVAETLLPATSETEREAADGIVGRAGRGLYTVQTETGRILPCRLRGNLKKQLTYPESGNRRRQVQKVRKLKETDPVAVGDFVTISIDKTGI